jgi:hypothetical protein
MPGNVSPVFDPQGLNHIWKKSEIYTGPTGTGIYVPKIDDLVYHFDDNVLIWERVSDLNIGNYLATLVPIAPQGDNILTPGEIALGAGPGTPMQTLRMFINTRTIPYSAALDSRYQVYGSAVVSCKVFAGTNVSEGGRVISAVYDNGGNYIGEDVPMELVASDAYNNNNAIKVVQPFKTSDNLTDGEVVTAVFYDSLSNVVGMQQFVVKSVAFVRQLGAGIKTVSGVGLLTPFLSTLNSKQIVYPRNLPLQAENLTGVVYYTDGSELHLSVDGDRFSVTGLDAYDATTEGISFPLVVKYELGVNEQAYSNVGGVDHVSEIFTVTTDVVNRQYETRLYVFPKWLDVTRGYTLTWWLYDASRSLAKDVTSIVDLAVDSAPFNPLAYGIKQTLKAKFNMADVAGNYEQFIVTQDVDVKLMATGTFRQDLSTPPNWFTSPISGHSPMFGGGVFAAFTVVSGLTKNFTVKGNISQLTDWLTAYFTNSQPLVLSPGETVPPTPTHFTISINGAEFQYPIDQWNQTLVISANCSNNDTLYVRFQYAGQQMLELGIAGMPLYQRNDDGSYV